MRRCGVLPEIDHCLLLGGEWDWEGKQPPQGASTLVGSEGTLHVTSLA